MKSKTIKQKPEHKSWYKRWWIIVLFIIVAYLIFKPSEHSEEELCANAIIEARSYLEDSDYDLRDWMAYEYDYNLMNEEVTSITIIDKNCEVIDRNNIEITFTLNVKTSNNRLAHVEAVVSVMDGYAEDVEFSE